VISVELLEGADLLLSDPRSTAAGVWPRAAALLARQAIETALLEFWLVRAPGLEWCSTHAQLLCLPDYVRDPEVAESASYAWTRLSRICHHHPYELLPTAAELRVLVDTARRLLGALATDEGPPPG
jgi:hypothetical protein